MDKTQSNPPVCSQPYCIIYLSRQNLHSSKQFFKLCQTSNFVCTQTQYCLNQALKIEINMTQGYEKLLSVMFRIYTVVQNLTLNYLSLSINVRLLIVRYVQIIVLVPKLFSFFCFLPLGHWMENYLHYQNASHKKNYFF